MATTWGNIVSQGTLASRLGLNITEYSRTDTTITFTVKVYFRSRYKMIDQKNELYLRVNSSSGAGVGSSGSVKTNTKINHPINTGSGWDSDNITLLYITTYTATRGTNDKKIYFSAKFTTGEAAGGTPKVEVGITVPRKPRYTIKYDAAGGSGTISSQTKIHGENITAKTVYFNPPEGHIAKLTNGKKYWKAWRDGKETTVKYLVGETIAHNGNQTLKAQWEPKTYTIKYNANGGTGAPGQQTATYGVYLTLSKTIPKRASKTVTDDDGNKLYTINYTFLYWSPDKNATSSSQQYKPNTGYKFTASQTLYAVWKETYDKVVYTLTYDLNGGHPNIDKQTKVANAAGVVPEVKISSIEPKKRGYVFNKQWKDENGIVFKAGDFWSENKNLKLTAQYDTTWNYLYFKDRTDPVQVSIEGVNRVDFSSEGLSEKEGYIFVGWRDDYDRFFSPGDEYRFIFNYVETDKYGHYVKNIYLSPVWKRKNIRFYQDGLCQSANFVEKQLSTDGGIVENPYQLAEDGTFTTVKIVEIEECTKAKLVEDGELQANTIEEYYYIDEY